MQENLQNFFEIIAVLILVLLVGGGRLFRCVAIIINFFQMWPDLWKGVFSYATPNKFLVSHFIDLKNTWFIIH